MTLQQILRTSGFCALLSAASLNGQITFSFNYTGTGGFLDATNGAARRAALEDAGTTLAAYFTTAAPRTITFDVNSYTTNDSTLASAGSSLISSSAGFHNTIVQEKIINGVDSNGATADGTISWNWHHLWNTTSSVPSGQYDFKSTAMHEILHAFGFSGSTASAGNNTGTAWNVFDKFLTTSTGAAFVNPTTFAFDTSLNSALTGNGMYFSGSNAMAANSGTRVSIYSPTPWSDGSSGSHTADGTYPGTMMIAATNSGPSARTLTAIEIGMLKDLGYTMAASAIPEPSTYAVIFGSLALGAVVIRRRRQSA